MIRIPVIRFRNLIQFILFTAAAALALAQAVPGRYIVEFQDEPALSQQLPVGRLRTAQEQSDLGIRRAGIRAAQAAVEPAIRQLGVTVRTRFDLVFNGMSIDADEATADSLRQLPNVRAVYPVTLHHAHLDHAMNVHQVREAWQSITGGQIGAGAGIKIGIIDSGIDTGHPAFQGFTTAVPSGFPKLSSEALRPYTNNKVIVARDYTGEGAEDLAGHGTSVAMAAAGGIFDPKVLGIPAFTGVAPGAWLGSYHVFNSNGESNSDLLLQAIQDAVSDGMNVLNYSGGAPVLNASDENGPETRAIRNALAAGVLVVVSAGNDGPEPGTAHTPGASADALTVGANANERIFDDGVTVADLPAVAGQAGGNSSRTDQVSGTMVDVAALDPTGLACSALPPVSLKGQIALISRGTCPFDDKANNAETAGAIGVVVFNNDPNGGLITMAVPTATVPTMFVTNASGLALKTKLASTADAAGVIDYSGTSAVPSSSDDIPAFSASGPTVGSLIKPDLVAVGSWLVTANTTSGTQFNVAILDGTSFSAPIVTGAVAALIGARPGLTAAQYRSLIVNSAPRLNWPTGDPVSPQIVGSGKLNLLRAISSSTAANPTSISFQTVPGAYDITRQFTVTNLGDAIDTFTAAVTPVNKAGAVATIDATSFTLAKNESKTLTVRVNDDAPNPGEVQGFIEVAGTKSSITARVPYWLGIRGGGPKHIAVLQPVDFTGRSPGDQVSFLIRVVDGSGSPVQVDAPEITTTGRGGGVVDVAPAGGIPGTFRVTVRAGRADADGLNVFTLTAGTATRRVIFVIR